MAAQGYREVVTTTFGSGILAPFILALIIAVAGTADAEYALTMDEEIDEALLRAPDLKNGQRIFQICTECHSEKAWGTTDGEYPQLAG